MTLSIPFAALALVVGASGCAESGVKASLDTASHELDTGNADSASDDSTPPADPAWFTPRAVIDLTAGVMSISQLTLIVVDSDLVTEICDVYVDPGAGVAAAPPDPSVAVWLDVTVVSSPEDCATLPAALGLGIGELPGDVRAQLGPSGLEDAADSIYGAFARAPNEATTEVSAFGYAGTAADLTGDDLATLPPPDGQYILNPLFLLRIPDSGE